MPTTLNKLASCVLKEMCFAVVTVDTFQIVNVDLMCIVLHPGVECNLDNIFATIKKKILVVL